MKERLIFFLAQIILVPTLFAQVQLEFIQPPVTQDGKTLSLPFAGGINSAQYQSIDIDGDEDLDLVLFDRSSDKINCFENLGSSYTYRPDFEYLFPNDLQHWLVLADYDCDGNKDLFTYTGQGIRVFRNNSSSGELSWELVVDPLKTQGSSSQINLLFNPTDIPSIADIDGDGDLDILVFDFASSFQIEFHQNHSVENSGACGLEMVRETRTYGDIRDCGCDDFTINTPCDASGRILHAGGKALLSMDYDLDGLLDLVLSQEGCNNLNFGENTGTSNTVSFGSITNNFPSLSTPIDFTIFPAAFYADVTFDGKKDLLVSSNERSNATQHINFKSSSLVYENIGGATSNEFISSSPFLQDQMIDVGEFAYPAIVDINGDGANDLIIGNGGSLINNTFVASLTYYQSDGTALQHRTDDLYDLSSLGYSEIKPQFIDLNNDQRIDLVFSAFNNSNITQLYYILNQSGALESLNISELQFIDFNIPRLDDYTLFDINEDGLPDLLLGLSNGRLDYYANTGTASNPIFSLETEGFLNIESNNGRSNLSLAIGDLDLDQRQDLITTDRTGQIQIYTDFISGNTIPQSSIIKAGNLTELQVSRLGRITKPAVSELLGNTSLVIGSIQGGVRLLATSSSIGEGTALEFSAFPVPTQSDGIIKFSSNLSATRLEIFSLIGGKLLELNLANPYTIYPVNLSHLDAGLYLAKATYGKQSCTLKLVVSK